MLQLTCSPSQYAEAVSYLYALLEGEKKEAMLRLHRILMEKPEDGQIEELVRNASNWAGTIEKKLKDIPLLPEQHERLTDLARKLRYEPLSL